MSYNYCASAKNMDTKSMRAYKKLFWHAYIKNLRLIRLKFGIFSKKLSQGSLDRKDLELDHSSMKKTIILVKMLIYYFKNKKSLKAVNFK